MTLRNFLSDLERSGELLRVEREVDPRYELPNVLNALGERPVIFENVKGYDMPVFGGICSTRELVARGLGVPSGELLHTLVNALDAPSPPPGAETAPCQEVVIMDVDLDRLPILTHLPVDGGRYVTSSVVIVNDLDTGRNASFHRLMQRDSSSFTGRLIEGRQTRTAYERSGCELEAAVCIGSSPAVLVAASLGPPPEVDELSVANALEPTPLVRCVTKDIMVPADTELVLECRITGETDDEGPFLDLTGTPDIVRKEPVFRVDAVTMRSDAMYQALLPGGREHKLLMGMPKEPTIYREVSEVADCRNVHVTPGGGSWLHGVVQICKRSDDEIPGVIAAAFRGHPSMKHVWVVDEDVDIFDPLAVEWAVATRFQAGRDLHVFRDVPGSSLDPSARKEPGRKALTDKVGFDATRKAGENPEKYDRVQYEDVDAGRYADT